MDILEQKQDGMKEYVAPQIVEKRELEIDYSVMNLIPGGHSAV